MGSLVWMSMSFSLFLWFSPSFASQLDFFSTAENGILHENNPPAFSSPGPRDQVTRKTNTIGMTSRITKEQARALRSNSPDDEKKDGSIAVRDTVTHCVPIRPFVRVWAGNLVLNTPYNYVSLQVMDALAMVETSACLPPSFLGHVPALFLLSHR